MYEFYQVVQFTSEGDNRKLNQLSEEGWELTFVTCISNSSPSLILYTFKREKQKSIKNNDGFVDSYWSDRY